MLLCPKFERHSAMIPNLPVWEVSVPPMKAAAPNPHPEHMFNILWAQAEQSTETQLRIRGRESGREKERVVKWKYG